MAKTYEITYSTTFYTHFYIEAESDTDAIEKGGHLLFCDDFVEGHLIPQIDDPWQWNDAILDSGISAYPSDCEPTLDVTMFD